MKRLLKERRPLRTAFTRACSAIESEPEESLTVERCSVLLNQLVEKYNRLDELHVKILDLILSENETDDAFDQEFDVVEGYRDRFVEKKVLLENKMAINNRPAPQAMSDISSRQVSQDSQHRRFKLPQIKLKKFSGEALEWLGFWAQFKQIHEDESIVIEDKFQYLLQCMVPGSRAASLVESFPPTAANYMPVIERLKARFARNELLVQVYIRQLFSLVLENGQRGKINQDLSGLYDRLESYIGALGTLGRTKEKFAEFLAPLVESCLPEGVLRNWERFRSRAAIDDTDSTVLLDQLMDFLRKEVEGEERISLVKSGFCGSSQRETVPKKVLNRPQKEPTAAALTITEVKREGCIFCRKNHASSECFTARRMSDEDKREAIKKANCCFICLKEGHSSRTCRAKLSCIICGKRHFVLMCTKLKEIRENDNIEAKVETSANSTGSSESVKESDAVVSKTLAVHNPKAEVTLMTMACFVKNGDRSTLVRCLLDTGSQRSYLTVAAAHRLGLKPVKRERIIHGLFGGKQTAPQFHPVYQVRLVSLTGDFECSIQLLEQRVICSEISPISTEETDILLRTDNIVLAHHDEAPREIVLGADLMGSVLTGEIRQTSCGLVALRTRLGWTVMGHSDYVQAGSTAMTVLSLHVLEKKTPLLWTTDILGIKDPIEASEVKRGQEESLRRFEESIKINKEGRYQVDLPFHEAHVD